MHNDDLILTYRAFLAHRIDVRLCGTGPALAPEGGVRCCPSPPNWLIPSRDFE